MNAIMTIEEVAAYLRVSDRTVYDWAVKGEIPAGRLGTSWRFLRKNIEEWVERKLSPPMHPQSGAWPVSSVLTTDRIIITPATRKAAVLEQLIARCRTIPGLSRESALTDAILRREQLMSTGLGRGLAIPHARLASVTSLYAAAALCTSTCSDYDSLDGEPVRLVVLVITGRDLHTPYIQVVSRFSRLVRDSHSRERLYAQESAGDLFAVMQELDSRAADTPREQEVSGQTGE